MQLLQISAWNDSGGSFLNRLLDGHPDLVAWPFELLLGNDRTVNEGLLDADWFRGRFRWPVLPDPSVVTGGDLFDHISDHELKTRLQRADVSKHASFKIDVNLDAWKSCVKASWSVEPEKTQARFIELYIRSFFAQWKNLDWLSGTQVLAHCPIAILDAPETWSDFPDARFIHVVRSPYSGFANMKRRHPNLKVENYARKWSIINSFATVLACKYPNRVNIVSLAQLLSQREATIDTLLDWADLQPSDTCYMPSWDSRAINEREMGPFGGVPDATSETEQLEERTVVGLERDVLTAHATPTVKLLEHVFQCPVNLDSA